MACCFQRRGKEKISRTVPTEEEALKKEKEAGLMDSADAQPVLEDSLSIKPCPPIQKLISTGRLMGPLPTTAKRVHSCLPKIA